MITLLNANAFEHVSSLVQLTYCFIYCVYMYLLCVHVFTVCTGIYCVYMHLLCVHVITDRCSILLYTCIDFVS